MNRQKRPKFTMINFRPTEEDLRILLDLMKKTDRGLTYIIRKALRKITLDDLLCPLMEGEPHDDDHNGSQD